MRKYNLIHDDFVICIKNHPGFKKGDYYSLMKHDDSQWINNLERFYILNNNLVCKNDIYQYGVDYDHYNKNNLYTFYNTDRNINKKYQFSNYFMIVEDWLELNFPKIFLCKKTYNWKRVVSIYGVNLVKGREYYIDVRSFETSKNNKTGNFELCFNCVQGKDGHVSDCFDIYFNDFRKYFYNIKDLRKEKLNHILGGKSMKYKSSKTIKLSNTKKIRKNKLKELFDNE